MVKSEARERGLSLATSGYFHMATHRFGCLTVRDELAPPNEVLSSILRPRGLAMGLA